ncbi:hypothetical protein Bbelb_308450 [Branchiostoma belcheri]|nr:hypothetical protein Bbelb_308450 [Branchiostoma belcheri]
MAIPCSRVLSGGQGFRSGAFRSHRETASGNQRDRRKEDGSGLESTVTASNESRKEVRDPMCQFLSAKGETKIGTWNVRTLYQTGKMAQLLKEFEEYQLNILGISEMRWTGSGKLCSDGKTVLSSGHEDQHRRGVGMVLDKEASRALTGWKPVNDRIITARFQSRHGKTTIVQVYAPTEDADEVDKDDFYEQLQDTFDNIPSHNVKILMGDFNAQIDSNRQGFDGVVGPFGTAQKTSDNGERLLLFCNINSLNIGNTYFQHKVIHKKTWRSPNGTTQNEIDYVCINQRWRSSLLDVRVFRGADVGSDHHLLGARVRLRLKKLTVQKKVKPYAAEKLKDPEVSQQYKLELQNRFQLLQDMGPDLEDQWALFKETVTKSAEETIGKRRVKKSCRADKRHWLDKKSAEAEEAAKKNDSRTLYRLVRELSGNWNNSSVPVKDKSGKTLLTTEEQDQRWVEHFQETLNQPTPDTLYDFGTEETAEQLDVCEEPVRKEETEEAIKAMKSNKAAGLDEISAEMLKHGGDCTVEMLTRLMNRCWQEGQVPRDWQEGVIVKLPKKGDLSNCNNWRGITLLSIPGKVFCAVLLRRLKKAVDCLLREEQAGFRSNRSCTEQIFTLRNIIEQCLEHQTPLALNFIDFKKAFDSIHRETLWNIALSYGIPARFVRIFKSLYENSRCCVRTEGGTTDFFNIITGVRQGCILSPFLFLITIDFVLRKTTGDGKEGIRWREESRLADLDFADDLALLSENNQGLQHLTTKLETSSGKVGLRVSSEKTKAMEVGNHTGQPRLNITVNNSQVEVVDQFTYLGSVISNSGEVEPDINCRVGKAASVFRRMNSIWSATTINLDTKLRLYNSIVLPTAIYASETWKCTAKASRKLDAFHQRNLRRILKVRWQDHITNDEILNRTKSKPLSTIITEKRMQLAGHILRLPSRRHSKTAMTWVPHNGRRKRGRPKHTWRRTFQDDLRRANIPWEEAETVAADKKKWKLAARCAIRHRRN